MTRKKKIIAMASGIMLIALTGWGLALLGNTVVNGWIPLTWSVAAGTSALAAVSATPTRNLTRGVVTFFTATAIAFWGLLAANYYLADKGSEREVMATVASKSREERHHTRRVHGRVVSTGSPYYVYYLSLQLPDGRYKKRQISLKEYNRIRTGSAYPLHLANGLLGWQVITARQERRE